MNHKNLVSAVSFIAALFVANTAFAKPPSWVDPDKGKIKQGEKTSVRVVVDEQGSFTAPPGWTTKWTQTRVGGDKIPCAPDRPDTCGVWVASATPSSDTTATFSYVPPTGPASNHTVSITVEALAPVVPPQPAAPPGGWYPADSGRALETRVDALAKSKESVRLYMHYGIVPNLETTTAPGHGLILDMSALVVDSGPAARFSIGGKFAFSRTMIPIDLALKPIVTEGSEDRYTGAFTLGWTPCVQLEDAGAKRDFWCFNVGALTGFQAYSYANTFNRSVRNASGQLENVEFVRERTQYSFILGPEIGTSVHITRNFGLGFGFSLPIDVTSVSRTIGEGSGNGQVAKDEAKGSVQANPTFHGGIEFFF